MKLRGSLRGLMIRILKFMIASRAFERDARRLPHLTLASNVVGHVRRGLRKQGKPIENQSGGKMRRQNTSDI